MDEYQDIHQAQYDLVSAIAGRTLEDIDGRLSIMAVGDDDQNIYAFRVWDDCAILARSRNALWPVRSLLEQAGVPVKTLIENSLPLNRVREFSAFRDRVKADKWEVPVLEVVFEKVAAKGMCGVERGRV